MPTDQPRQRGSGPRVIDRGDGLHEVTFLWSDINGLCVDCGLPAAFRSIDAYGPGDHQDLCSVCAANAAAESATIRRIDHP